MRQALRRFFKLHAGELAKVVEFGLLGAFLQAGIAVGIATADALFLTNLGAARLPLVYLLLALVMVAVTPFLSHLTARLGIARAMSFAIVTLALGDLIVHALLVSFPAPWVFFAAKLFALGSYLSVYALYWNFLDAFFSILDGKRLFAFFSGGLAFGAIAGGSLVSVLAPHLAVAQLFVLSAILALGAYPVFMRINRRWPVASAAEQDEDVGLFQQMSHVLSSLRRSRYALLLATSFALLVVVLTMSEFQYLNILSKSRTEEQMATLFGKLFVFVNAFNFIVNFLIFNRIILYFGVRNAVLIQPVAMIAVFSALVVDGGEAVAIAGFFAYHGLQISVDYNTWNFLVNALPAHGRRDLRTIIEALEEPLGIAATGAFLLYAAPKLSPQQLSSLGLLIALLYLLVSFFVRHDYASSLIGNLRRGWLDLSASEGSIAGSMGPETLVSLGAEMRRAPPAEAAALGRYLLAAGSERAHQCILEAIFQRPPSEREAFAAVFGEIVAAARPETAAELWGWIGRELDAIGPELLEELCARNLVARDRLLALAQAADPRLRAAAAVALWRSWCPDDALVGVRALRGLLQGEGDELVAGIRAVGRLGDPRYAHALVPFLQAPGEQVRAAAVEAASRLVTSQSSRLVGPLLSALENGSGEMRQASITALGAIGDSASVVPLLHTSAVLNPRERRLVEKTIDSVGLRAIPGLVSVLRDLRNDYEARSLAARSLGRLAFGQLDGMLPGLLRPEIRRAFRYLSQGETLREAAGASVGRRVLAAHFHSVHRRSVIFVLELLALGGRLGDFDLVVTSLRSDNEKVRGDALETLEQFCPRAIFRLLLPLVDTRPVAEKLLSYRRTFAPPPRSAAQIVEESLHATQSLEAAAACFATWEAHPEEARERLAERLLGERGAELRIALSELLGESGDRPLNLVEKVDHLLGTEFFSRVGTFGLARIAAAAVERHVASGDLIHGRGNDALAASLILEGSAHVVGPAGESVAAPGTIVGKVALLGPDTRHGDTVTSRGARILALQREKVFAAAEVSPEIGIELLRNATLAVPAPLPEVA
ncbi:MAG: HEAT repeat domain-containing protein [Candidatus Schekmanbacteria bacterium]|nr:HEAT repeat domain-containing protein [Candidatus Schekmanbacteria bacterium]